MSPPAAQERGCAGCVALLDVLAFYGNPRTYTGCPPFIRDIDDYDDHYYEFTDVDLGILPGHRARKALMKHSREGAK